MKKTHEVFFHSGATESINLIFKGIIFCHLKSKNPLTIFTSDTDHSSVYNQRKDFEFFKINHHKIPIDQNGVVKWKDFTHLLKETAGDLLINFTWVNNETGVVNDIEQMAKLKEEIGERLLVHVDAVQSIGKIENFLKLPINLDYYSYSAHKFGAMKGVGFTFISHKNLNFHSIMRGGGQQFGLRSGTENTMGIYSIKLALSELFASFHPKELLEAKNILESAVEASLKNNGGYVIAKSAPRNLNTIYFIVKNSKADQLIMNFDMIGIDISSGSACSSGAVEPSRVLLNLGFSEEEAKGALRLSFSPNLTTSEAKLISEKLKSVLSRY